jgi:hypothetical protein
MRCTCADCLLLWQQWHDTSPPHRQAHTAALYTHRHWSTNPLHAHIQGCHDMQQLYTKASAHWHGGQWVGRQPLQPEQRSNPLSMKECSIQQNTARPVTVGQEGAHQPDHSVAHKPTPSGPSASPSRWYQWHCLPSTQPAEEAALTCSHAVLAVLPGHGFQPASTQLYLTSGSMHAASQPPAVCAGPMHVCHGSGQVATVQLYRHSPHVHPLPESSRNQEG